MTERVSSSDQLTLAIDTGSPTVSVAVGRGSALLGESSFPGGPSSPSLLDKIDGALASAGHRIGDVERLIGARGPGSFTGLRSGLATLLGLHQALGIPAVAVPSFLPLAMEGPAGATTVGAIDALRGEWFAQAFSPDGGSPISAPQIVPPGALVEWAPCVVVSFGADRLKRDLDAEASIDLRPASPLAPILLRVAESESLEWNSETLIAPLYLRPPTAKPVQRGL